MVITSSVKFNLRKSFEEVSLYATSFAFVTAEKMWLF